MTAAPVALPLRFGYGTNGFANHSLDQALQVIADLGYTGVALTLDHNHLDPFALDAAVRVRRVARLLSATGLAVVVETGARYLLDPWRKHYPSLVSAEQQPRVDLLRRAVDIAAELGAEAVSFWSGVDQDGDRAVAWRHLVKGTASVVDHAAARGVRLGFEPEPGMVVQTIADFEALRKELGDPEALGLTLDIGHCRCVETAAVPECVRQAAPYLVNVQIDDMVRGVHEHLEFGAGEIHFPPVLAALADAGYAGLVAVELPRHSHDAPRTARRCIDFLTAAASDAAHADAFDRGLR